MAGRPYVLAEATWKTVKDMDYEVAILPWGATEAHNFHLPYGTDAIQASHVAITSAGLAWERGARVIALPAIPYGVNTGQLDIKLVINMSPSTQATVLGDIVSSLAGQGIRKLVVLNAHGGNDFKQMIRELQAAHSDMFLCTVDWWRSPDISDLFKEPGDHGGAAETSSMMHIRPDLLLDLSEAGDGAARSFKFQAMKEKWAWAQREWTAVTKDTGVGDPAEADPAKGKEFLSRACNKVADFLVELAECPVGEEYEG
ncbi:MAG: creatininase family protein [Kiritimatiellae bacterium]|nr:creatininase family protein [Kiritimatiellia bacterium]